MQPGYPPGPPGYPPGPPGYPPGQPGYPPGPQGPPGYPPAQQGPPAGQPQQNSWQWRYMAATFSATLAGGTLSVKQGIRSFNIEIAKLLYLYVSRTSSSVGSFETTMLCHQPSPGKKKVVRLMSNTGDPGMQALVSTILSLRPDIDIRHLDEKTAHKTMGATRMQLVALFIAFFAVMGVMGVLLLPQALHGIDTGQERVSITKLYSGYEPSTHNLIVSGIPDLDDAMFEKTTRKGTTTVEYYLPLVPPGWKKTDPVHIILKTGDLGPAAQNELVHARQFEGVLDNILWEGLSGKVQGYLTGHMGLKIADDVRVIHYKEDSQTDLFIFIGVMGLTFVIMIVVFGIVILKRRRA